MRALNKTEFLSLLQQFLPQGTAWSRALGSVLSRLMTAFAQSMALMDLRLQELLAELDPSTSTQLLPEWEAFVASDDECCSMTVSTLPERRRQVITRLTEVGGLSRAYFLQLAADLGYLDTTITEFRPTHCEMNCEVAVMDERWRFVWKVNLPHEGNNYSMFRADSRADERVDAYTFGALECLFMKLRPAHTYVIFTYEGLA